MNKLRIWLDRKIPSGGFLRSVVTLMTGTTFAQLLLVIIAPILTRLYEPEYFGTFTMFSSILAIMAIISCLRYELAIVLPKSEEDAANLLALSFLICSVVSIFSFVLIVFFRGPISVLLGAPELKYLLWFIPISILTLGFFQALNYWNIRGKRFNRLAIRQITQSGVTASTQVSYGTIINAQAGGLIGGQFAGQIAATGWLLWQTWKENGKQILSYLSTRNIRKNIVEYRNFPIYSLWSGLLNTASVMIPPLVLGYFFTPAVVGFYALGQRTINLPMSIVGDAVAQVFFPYATEANRNGNLDSVTLDVFKNLLSIALVPISLISLVAPELFSFVFGENWYEAGQYVRWMSIWLIFVFISSPLSNLYLVMERQRLGLFIDILLFSSRLAVLIIGGIFGDPLFTIALFAVVSAVLWMTNCTLILFLAGLSLYKVLRELVLEILKALPYTGLTFFILFSYDNSFILIMSAILSGIIFILLQYKKIKKIFA
ncbi:oligosaccharide flippase family protein [Fictibacillus sp. WQ 8-8]|uniref:oligosaccharide flippase family protein n=1 Tax=Fictibacillus sp. WQ 8-8 TaxID=2938788 RepID=UPI0021087DCE|nr:oligosaccharide flippase family protein [Fictibacillus sp. WQ 8-8]MCQ6264727.1 oligosaccharide flippase family protein [Fictibacillus sp. WQ 8-8]